MEFVFSLQFTVTIFFYNDNIIIKDEKCKQHVGASVVNRIKSTKPKQSLIRFWG